MNVYQPVAHIQGNRMMDPGTTARGPLFFTRYQAQKWIALNWYTEPSTHVKKVKVYHKVEEV